MTHTTLIISGSVAAVRSFQLIKELKQAGHELDIVVTDAVWDHKFFESPKYKPTDEELAELKASAISEHDGAKIHEALSNSETVLVCPASADMLSQITNGSSTLGKAIIDHDKPLHIVPAMNVMMWQHPAVVHNVKALKDAHFMGPILGKMACGDQGYGRIAEVSDIISALETGDRSLFDKAEIKEPLLPQKLANVKKILLMAHHNDNGEAVKIAQDLVDQGFKVQAMLTEEAKPAAAELERITGNKPVSEHYQHDPQGMEHIRLPEQSDVVVVAPASQKYLNEMAHGASKSLVGCAYLATKKPVIVMAEKAPALKAHGAKIVRDAEQLNSSLMEGAMTQDLSGKKILVWAGNPRERVDTFRFYMNDRASKQQALSEIALLQQAGAEVTVIAPASSKIEVPGAKVISTLADGKKIESARDMLAASTDAGSFDEVRQLAGVSSIACDKPATSKIQKTGPDSAQLFEVIGNIDVDKKLKELFPDAKIAGYDRFQNWFGDKALRPAPVAAALPETQPQQRIIPRMGPLSGKRVIVTTARTEEILTTSGDKITNFFSGRQGQAIATAFANKGAQVTLLSGPTELPDVNHPNITTIHTTTAKEMHDAAQRALSKPAAAFIGAAAIADFGMDRPLAKHLPEGEAHTLELSENPSVVGAAAHHANRPRVVVNFAAQSPETIVEYAKKKFDKLGVDLTVANPIGDKTIAASDPTKNQVIMIKKEGISSLPEMGKDQVAEKIADEVSLMLMKSLRERPEQGNGAALG